MTKETGTSAPPVATVLDGLDLGALRAYLDRALPGFVDGRLHALLLAGGHSNLTFEVRDESRRWVLRRPPLGDREAAAHDMHREYRTMRALQGTDIPVPETFLHCDDLGVLGAPFFLMSFVDGIVYHSHEDTAGLQPARAGAISLALVDVLARLHGLEPASVGLGDLGRPAGYLERQVRRWTDQAIRTMPAEPGVDALASRLRAEMPTSSDAALVHGDFRLDNVVVSPDDDIVAVLDWEMATLGDPLADLGLLWCYWEGLPHNEADTMRKGIDPALGFPSITELVDYYAARTGRDVSSLPWYVAFGYFKLAVLRARIHQRYVEGNTPARGFETVGALIIPLLAQSRQTLES